MKKKTVQTEQAADRRSLPKIEKQGPARIVVKFKDNHCLPYIDALEKLFCESKHAVWENFVREFPGCSFRRVYQKIDPKWVENYAASAAKAKPSCDSGKLLNYFILECQDRTRLEPILQYLAKVDIIQTAYVAPQASDAQANPGWRNPRSREQFHLKPPPFGINAVYAWTVAGGDGAGQSLIDLEQGWTLDHDELAYLRIPGPLFGTIVDLSRPHGTSVLGIVCAEDNAAFGVGITPNLAPGAVNVVSYSGVTTDIPEAIAIAAQQLGFGGVLVIEADIRANDAGPRLPCETDPLIFQQIQIATANGVVVVEAAGNGNVHVDGLINGDSGAILVGAANLGMNASNKPTWPRRPNSNYGARVDCFAQGERVYSANSNQDPQQPDLTGETFTFDSTSAATAIIAGAALSVQGMAQALTGAKLPPGALRDLLRRFGTPSSNSQVEPIGIMPDLELIANELSRGRGDV